MDGSWKLEGWMDGYGFSEASKGSGLSNLLATLPSDGKWAMPTV